jgi:hypothetical protein
VEPDSGAKLVYDGEGACAVEVNKPKCPFCGRSILKVLTTDAIMGDQNGEVGSAGVV